MFKKIKQYIHYIIPVILSIILLSISCGFQNSIKNVIIAGNIKEVIFSFLGTLMGFILTSYVLLFGIIPSLEKELTNSKQFSKINTYFFFCLILTIIILAISGIYLFLDNYYLFIVISSMIGFIMGMLFFITCGIRNLLKIMKK